MNAKIKACLEQIGLTHGEIQVYTALIKLGITTTGSIAKESNISNSKVYEVLHRLTRKGLVSFVIKNNTRHYKATAPERIIDFLNEKQETIEQNKKELLKVMPALKSLRKTETSNTTVYEGKQGIRTIINDIIEEQTRGGELLTFGSDNNILAKKYPDIESTYAITARKKKFVSRALFSQGTKPYSTLENQRSLPKGMLSPVRIAIYGNKVAIFKFSELSQVILIEDNTIAKGYREQFEFLWNTATQKPN